MGQDRLSSNYLDVAERTGRWLQSLTSQYQGRIPDALGDTLASASLGTGAAGRILFFLELFEATRDSSYLESARSEGNVAIILTESDEGRLGLYNGSTGVGFGLAELSKRGDEGDMFSRAAIDRFHRAVTSATWDGPAARWEASDDVMTGTAGIGLGLLYAWDTFRNHAFLATAIGAGEALLASSEVVRSGRRWHRWNNRELDLPNFSHGTSGVAYFLARLSVASGDSRFLSAAIDGANYVISIADRSGNLFLVPYGVPNDGYATQFDIGWAHGPAGTARMFHELWEVTGDTLYWDILDAHAKTILATGMPAAPADTTRWSAPYVIDRRFGTSGAASFLFDSYRLTDNEAYRTRALDILDSIRMAATEMKDGVFWTLPRYGFQGGDGEMVSTGYFYGASGFGFSFLHGYYAKIGGELSIRFPDDPLFKPISP